MVCEKQLLVSHVGEHSLNVVRIYAINANIANTFAFWLTKTRAAGILQ